MYTYKEAIQAMRSLVDGVFDDPLLMCLGPLTTLQEDLLRILDYTEKDNRKVA